MTESEGSVSHPRNCDLIAIKRDIGNYSICISKFRIKAFVANNYVH